MNIYATLAEYKSYVTARGQTSTTDTADDAVIEMLLKSVSRYYDTQTGRRFYPYVQTRYFDVPSRDSIDVRSLKMDADLLEVLAITNGDGITIPSSQYATRPRNDSPYNYIRLSDTSTYYWASDGSGNTHDVISVRGIWGYHNDYANAWSSASTLAEDLDTTETGIDVTSGTSYAIGNITRIDDEICYISAKSTNTLTGTRSFNGSTAATHTSGEDVLIWLPMDELKAAVLETAMQAYKRRFGATANNTATVTAAGIVLSPKDIPAIGTDFIKSHRRYV